MNEEYGFCDRLTENFPSQIIVDITEVCTLACIHCPHPQFKQSEHYARRMLSPELNKKMVDEVRTHSKGSCKYIRYTSNGEPLVHPKGYEMIEYAVNHSGTYVTLTTNGTIMNEKKTKRLLASGVHMIDISIDAYTAETYAKVRVNGDLEITRTNVQRLIRWIREGGFETKVVVSYVEQPENEHETLDFEKFWRGEGVSEVVIRRLHSAGGQITHVAEEMKQNNEEDRYPCVYPWERLVLDPKGFLAFCPADWGYSSPIADFHNISIKDAWQGEFMNNLRKAHLNNDYSCHHFCGQCPDWMQIRWPHQGRAYADLVGDLKAAENSES